MARCFASILNHVGEHDHQFYLIDLYNLVVDPAVTKAKEGQTKHTSN